MRATTTLPLLLSAAALPGAQNDHDHHQAAEPTRRRDGQADAVAAPAGWTIRPDGKGDAAKVKVVGMGQGLHITTGPAIVLYRADTKGSGSFHTLARFTQTKPSAHPEGYGLLFGGKALDGPAQQYFYFLVHQDEAT
jgi:hypothetical protein